MNNSKSEILQIHYFLSGGRHSMNAIVLNQAEKELLAIINEVSKTLGVHVSIETKALNEGGIRSFYSFVTNEKSKKNALLLCSFIAGIAGNVISNVVSDSLSTNKEIEMLEIEKLKLEIKLLKSELSEKEDDIQNNIELMDNAATLISDNSKVKVLKSNFYKKLKTEAKIQQVSTQRLDFQYNPISEEKIVNQNEFDDFIIENTEIDDDYQEQVEIEIVSPVLTKNKSKWKGIFNNRNLTFTLKDLRFKRLISTKKISFSNGTKIICDLETSQSINSEGVIKLGTKRVYNVSGILYNDGTKIDIDPSN